MKERGQEAEGAAPPAVRIARFRSKLLLATTFAISASALLVLYASDRRLAANARQAFELEFHGALDGLHHSDDMREAVMAERCRQLARKSRIHAAIEDGALDLLYPSAQDELSDLMIADALRPAVLRAQFYRFLGADGAPIRPAAVDRAGSLAPGEEKALGLSAPPRRQEIGYTPRSASGPGGISELVVTPIVSAETGEVIAALVLGFEPGQLAQSPGAGIRSGIWLGGKLHLPGLGSADRAALSAALSAEAGRLDGGEGSFRAKVAGSDELVFVKPLNPGSPYPPACEVCLYPLAELLARQRKLRLEVLAGSAAVLLAAFSAGEILSRRLSAPVERLAVESERSARFSADASHQLRTPVTVLRAGLEELLLNPRFTPEECAGLSDLIHQTYRLSSLIDDLLLLSRMDAGRLRIERTPVDLRRLVEGCMDDLGAVAEPAAPALETELRGSLMVLGERRYTAMILHNLLENARKYNRPGGRIRIDALERDHRVVVRIGNSGPGIPARSRDRIFERFHRGGVGEETPGYGLGLNLARELARVHGGDLRLLGSEDDWTEFELTLERAPP